MGYQESIVTTKNPKDFYKLVERVKRLGREYYNNESCDIPLLITVKKMIELPYNWPVGTQFLYVVGERYMQRDEYDFLNIPDVGIDDDLHDAELSGLDESIDFEFVAVFADDLVDECFYDKDKKIYAGMNHEYIEVEEFLFESEL